ncbi:MAG: TraB/GumN family protein [Saprospiraceae bacterium]|nr:TraB/GumN family protein [Saprospiraceae bacterium]
MHSGDSPPSFIFGTMHVRSTVAHQFLDGILPFIRKTDVLAAEMNLNEFDQVRMLKGTRLPEGTSLELLMGEKKFSKTRRSLKRSFGIDLMAFQFRHPFLVSASISESLLVLDQLESLDQEIWNQALASQKICVGLESFDDQLNIMQEISLEKSARQIYEIGRNPGRFRRNLLKMINYYSNQDVDNLYKSSRKQLQGLRKKLLFQRNEKMTDHFISLLTENTVFAAVGAAHLAGEKGMLRLVKKKGFKLKPIPLMQ